MHGHILLSSFRSYPYLLPLCSVQLRRSGYSIDKTSRLVLTSSRLACLCFSQLCVCTHCIHLRQNKLTQRFEVVPARGHITVGRLKALGEVWRQDRFLHMSPNQTHRTRHRAQSCVMSISKYRHKQPESGPPKNRSFSLSLTLGRDIAVPRNFPSLLSILSRRWRRSSSIGTPTPEKHITDTVPDDRTSHRTTHSRCRLG